jgi:hypothetical protein
LEFRFKFGEPVVFDNRRVCLPVLGLLLAGYLLISPRFAHAQLTDRDTTWAVMDVTSVINRAIEESKESTELREKVVRRFSECSLMYGGLSTLASNAEVKKNYVQAQVATMEIESTIAKPLQSEKRIELEETARKTVALLLRTVKAQGDKEVGPLVKKCKAINDLKEIKNALQELSSQ